MGDVQFVVVNTLVSKLSQCGSNSMKGITHTFLLYNFTSITNTSILLNFLSFGIHLGVSSANMAWPIVKYVAIPHEQESVWLPAFQFKPIKGEFT